MPSWISSKKTGLLYFPAGARTPAMMTASKRTTASIILAGVLIAAAIIGGVTALQDYGLLPVSSSSTTEMVATSATSSSSSTRAVSTSSTSAPIQISTNTTSSSSASTGPPSGAILAVQMTDPPNVPANVTHVYIAYSDIQVGSEGSEASGGSLGWYTVAKSGQIDLMSILNSSVTLGAGQVVPGTFNLVKFDIASAEVDYNGQNYSAYVPANRMSIPIPNGGITVGANGTSALIIDMSPTVLPFQNGALLGFVLAPAAICFPIPPLAWNDSFVQQGSTEPTNASWFQQSETNQTTNMTIVGASLTNHSLSVTVQNTGNTNITISELDVLENVTSTVDNSTSSGIQTVVSFQVLDNATLVPSYIDLSNDTNASVGFIFEPNQTLTFTYSGEILPDCGSGCTPIDASPIFAGTLYYVTVDGDLMTAYGNVTATN